MGGWLYAFEIPDPPSVLTVQTVSVTPHTVSSSPHHTHTTVTDYTHIHNEFAEDDDRDTSSTSDKQNNESEGAEVVEGSVGKEEVEGGESGDKVVVGREEEVEGGESGDKVMAGRGGEEGEREEDEQREDQPKRLVRRDESKDSSTDDITLGTCIGSNLRHLPDRPLGSRDPTPPILLAPEDDDRLTGDATTGFRAVGGHCVEEEGQLPGSHDSKMNNVMLESPTASPLHSTDIHDGFVFAIHRKTVSAKPHLLVTMTIIS